MPEGPEVRLSADSIRPLVINKKIYHVSVGNKSRYKDSLPDGMLDFPKNCKVESVNVKGKFMYWTFDNDWHLFNTFGMSGQWSPIEGKHPCFIFQFEDGNERMHFNDPRHFGTIKFVQGRKNLENKLNELGWDPLSASLDKNLKWITFQLSKTSKSIAEVLMDQPIFAGVGNYIRAEALYACKLSPWKSANKLSPDEIKMLCQACIDVMENSYQHQGATIHTYKTAYGEEGKYSSQFKVYGKKQDPMGHKIIKQTTPDKRTIHWCPDVQI